MELEHGKTYIDGWGKYIKVNLTHPGNTYPFMGDNYRSYSSNGKYCLGDTSKLDLQEIPSLKPQSGGMKFDDGKGEFDRLSFQALAEMNKVHKAGDSKYAEGNWRQGLDIKRLLNAAIRHITAIMDGELTDPETKTLHSANAAVNLEMVTHFLLNKDKYKDYINLPKRPQPIDRNMFIPDLPCVKRDLNGWLRS